MKHLRERDGYARRSVQDVQQAVVAFKKATRPTVAKEPPRYKEVEIKNK